MENAFLKVNNLIHQNGLTVEKFLNSINEIEIQGLSEMEKSNLLFRLIEVYFADKQFSQNELRIIGNFKSLFQIKEGVLLKNQSNAIRVFSMKQIEFFLKDGELDDIETEKLVSLQSAFDLSYDEFRELLKAPLSELVENGLDKDLVGKNYFLL